MTVTPGVGSSAGELVLSSEPEALPEEGALGVYPSESYPLGVVVGLDGAGALGEGVLPPGSAETVVWEGVLPPGSAVGIVGTWAASEGVVMSGVEISV